MEVKMATTATTTSHLRQYGCSQTFASTISLFDQRGRSPSSSSKKRPLSGGVEIAGLVCRDVGLCSLLGTPARLSRSQSCDQLSSRSKPLRRAHSGGVDSFPQDDFVKKIEELAHDFDLSDDGKSIAPSKPRSPDGSPTNTQKSSSNPSPIPKIDFILAAPPWVEKLAPLDCPRPEMPMLLNNERKFEEIPSSIRMGKKTKKKKKKVEDGGLSESVYSSMKTAFSSMVFMIRELQSFSFQIRQVLFCEDLRQILVFVQRELHASFVWLFRQVFSSTPTLMVYIMILLANFTVYSMTQNTVLGAAPPAISSTMDSLGGAAEKTSPIFYLKGSSILAGKTISVGGGMGGGGTGRSSPVAGGTDGGDGRVQRELLFDASAFSSVTANPTTSDRGRSGEEEDLWGSIVQEAKRMQSTYWGDALDPEAIQALTAPVVAKMEPDDTTAYFRTQLVYQTAIEMDPHNPLLLSNYAQFLRFVVHDHDRAEHYFQRAASVVPPDAEALSRYANFLWLVRKNILAAEETFLEAIAAEPGNTFYAANYAHFLWNTGGEDTCFPLEYDV